jgi:predicted nuclease of predicted toxin-antitoxin system
MTEQEILEDYPELESEDFRAVYEFAARMGRRVAL